MADVAVRCQLGRKSGCTVPADRTGRRRGEGSPMTKKYAHGGRRQGHDFSKADRTDRAPEDRVQYQRAGPRGQLLHR